MIDLLFEALKEALVVGIQNELTRIGREVSEGDGLSIFNLFNPDYDDYVTYITPEGGMMHNDEQITTVKEFITLSTVCTIQDANTLYEQLKNLDDDRDSLLAIGRTVLQKVDLKGRDIVDVVAEPVTEWVQREGEEEKVPVETFRILMATEEGKTFEVFIVETTE